MVLKIKPMKQLVALTILATVLSCNSGDKKVTEKKDLAINTWKYFLTKFILKKIFIQTHETFRYFL